MILLEVVNLEKFYIPSSLSLLIERVRIKNRNYLTTLGLNVFEQLSDSTTPQSLQQQQVKFAIQYMHPSYDVTLPTCLLLTKHDTIDTHSISTQPPKSNQLHCNDYSIFEKKQFGDENY